MNEPYLQRSDEKVDYEQEITGDTIVSCTWSISPAATLGDQTDTSTKSKIRLSGLASGSKYELSWHMVLTSGQEITLDTPVIIRCP